MHYYSSFLDDGKRDIAAALDEIQTCDHVALQICQNGHTPLCFWQLTLQVDHDARVVHFDTLDMALAYYLGASHYHASTDKMHGLAFYAVSMVTLPKVLSRFDMYRAKMQATLYFDALVQP